MGHWVTACKAEQLRVLVGSMLRHCQPFKLHVLAWDWTPGGLLDLEGLPAPQRQPGTEVSVTGRPSFIARHPDLATLPGPPRNTNETVCSVRWRFALDVLEATGQPVTLIDGDMFFFGSPEPLFDEIGDAPFALSPHAFAPAAEGLPGVTLESHGRYSRFNGGWSFWRDPEPLRAQAEMAEAWCYQGFHVDRGRHLFGDQGALELILGDFPVGHVIQHHGVNLGPWNANRWKLEERDGAVFVDDKPLISYHMQSLKPGQLANPEYAITAEQGRILYAPYLAALQR